MRIAIVDDCQTDRDELAVLASKTCEKLGVPCDIFPFISGIAFLQKFQRGHYDVILLDIFMNELNGIDTAHKIREVDKQVCIVFTTVTKDYAVQGFEVKASHYLVKPCTADKMESALRFCLTRQVLDERYIAVKEGYHEYHLLLSNILYTAMGRNYVILHTTRGEIKVYTSFVKFAPHLLNDARFVQCAYGVLLNMDHVNRLEKDGFVLDSGHSIPVPKRDFESIRMAWVSYEATMQEERWA
ncbi:LytTR family DNA-binding domain-containing protein [Ruminococcaceae bacterium OttesenSCG-928-I18]|nr:LytTR family DNA-binding domain-containing protein [Ruminococcaceae bacterium OttesenSCG-928-I18]